MNGLVLMLAATTFGVDYGWRRLEDGQLEYVIGLDSDTLQALEDGLSVRSDIPRDVRGVRRIRILKSTGNLPRDPVPSSPPSEKTPKDPPEDPPNTPNDPPLPDPSAANDSLPDNGLADGFSKPPDMLRPPPRGEGLIEQVSGSSNPPESHGRAKDEAESGTPTVDDRRPLQATTSANSSRPWGWLSAALLGLIVSVGLNFYQGWITLGIRRRYHHVVDRMRAAGADAV